MYAYLAANLLSIIPLLLGLKFKRIYKLLTSPSKIKDSCKFALFVGLLDVVYKAVLCLMRRLLI